MRLNIETDSILHVRFMCLTILLIYRRGEEGLVVLRFYFDQAYDLVIHIFILLYSVNNE